MLALCPLNESELSLVRPLPPLNPKPPPNESEPSVACPPPTPPPPSHLPPPGTSTHAPPVGECHACAPPHPLHPCPHLAPQLTQFLWESAMHVHPPTPFTPAPTWHLKSCSSCGRVPCMCTPPPPSPLPPPGTSTHAPPVGECQECAERVAPAVALTTPLVCVCVWL